MSKHIGKDSFKDKMKHLFGLGLSHNLKEQPEVKTTEFIITAERLKEMNAENALNVRMKAMKEVSDLVKTKRLEEHAVEAVWDAVADLLCAEQPVEARHMVLALLRCIIQGQGDRLGILRAIFFRIVRDYAVTEDLLQRVELFKALTDNGKDITYIDDEIGPFAVQWMDETMHSNLARDFLQLLVNIVKFNSSYLDQDKVIQLVQKICHLCNKTSQVGDIEASLKVLDAIVCYSCLPSESLTTFIVTLCHTVKVKELSEACWKLMRNLLGTHLGHSSIRTMCSLMEDRRNHKDAALLLGAVFFVGMALWGAFRLPTLKNSPTSVLPSFHKAMTEDMLEVSFEIVLSLTRLVKKYGKELQVVTWDILLDIMERLVQQTHTFRNAEFVNKVHDQLTAIEELYTRKDFHGCPQRFFGLVEKCSECRPNSSVLLLLSFRAQSIHPARDGWIGELRNLMDKYFRPQLNSTIRKKALEVMFSTLNTHRNLYEDELIEQVLGPQLLHVLEDRDASVRRAACQSLVDIARTCHSSNFSVLLEFIEKIISRELVERGAIEVPEDGDANESTTEDVEAAVIGLLDILKAKLYSLPARHAALAYDVLVAHLQAHYRLGYNHPAASAIRMQVFDFFFSLQADSSLRLGIINKRGELRFSVYCLCDSSDVERRLTDKRATGTISPPADSPTLCQSTIPYRFESLPFCKAFNCLLMCLKQERDWKVLKFVLEKLPDSLQNKALLLSSQCSIDQLCSSLCRMVLQVSNRRGGHGASLGPGRDSFPRNDLHLAVLPVLTALPSYHAHLDAAKQREIVVALETGLISRCGRLCVVALTMCIVEMANVMVKMLPSILLKLTHISATVTMASPMLEFLSTLVRIPILYSNFVAEQYISVFAICLPYTNPFKFNQYIVSLAHHVIAMWFIRCRLPFRKDFVQYITKGLRSNALLPFDDTASAYAASNDQSNFRARSTSLNDKPARSLWTAKHLRHPVSAGIPPHDLSAAEVFRTRSISITDPAGHRGQPPLSSLQGGSLEENPSPAPDDALRTVHLELTETCLDMMARYVFSNVSAVPRRSPAAEFLLEGGRSLTWLLGNKLITITTSAGSGNKALFCMDNKDSRSSKNLHNVQSTLPSRGSQEAPGKLESQSGQQLARAERVRQRSVSGGNALRANNDNTLRPLVPFLETSSSSAIPDTGEGPNRMQPTKDQKESPGPYCVPKDQALITDYAPYLTQGWAEVLIRRPTGNTSWMMRLQNFPSPFVDDLAPLPLHDLSTALLHINQDSGLNSDRPAGKGVSVRDVAPCGRGRPTSAVPQRAAIAAEPVFEAPSPLPSPPPPPTFDEGRMTKLHRSIFWAESKADHFSPFVQDLEEAATFVGPQASVPAAFFPAMEFCSENTSPEPPHLSPRDSLADLSRSSSTSLHGGEQFVQPEEGGMCTESPRPVPSRDRSQEDDEEEDEEQRLLQQQGRVHGLNKSSSSPELSTLRELTKEWEEGAEWPVHKANVPMSISCNPPPSSSELPLPLSREESQANGNQSNSMYRPRGHTISESTTSWRRSVPGYQAQRGANDKVPGGASPSFVFLQLFYSPFFANETNKPILLPKSQVIERAVKVLDRMPPYDTHKIGVIYVGEGQAHSEAAILANEWGSPRYAYFIQALGRLVRLQDCDPEHVFLGGLDTGGEDGRFACCSHDDIMQMMFHVATLMPNKETDKNCSNKKRHICNSYVTVVYNDSHDEYKLGTLTGQFNFVEIIIKPLDYESNLVTIQARKELEGLIDTSVVKIVSDRNLSLLVRQMALHANMASLVHMHRDHHHEEYAFKWLARLRQVKRIRGKVLEELQNRRGQGKPTSSTSPVETGQRTRLISTMDDFSGFV